MPVTGYFSRRLSLTDASNLNNRVDEAEFLEIPGNKVVLGEPGMGKSELMRELGRRLGVEPVTATRFMQSKNPARLVPEGKTLLIDGLDEAMSRREGDAVDAILAQLEEADSPPFILTCRSREWQARTVANLRQLYGDDPRILTLDPFDRVEARAYLVAQYSRVDSDHVLDHLAAHSLEELYRNPLTLGLMGRVAETDQQLPGTRAALFERVCSKVWPEHDPDRQDAGLAQLSEDEALDAAGAISACLLFAGAEAASVAGAVQVQEGDLRIADLESLPKASSARAIFSSKLFQSVGPSRAKPLHRVIAEYLGARWLARQATTPRTQRRVLAQLHGSNGVPASLRGLHAWLAYHSPAMAERVIASDPYGVLRYGETTALTPHLADRLLEELCLLAEDDPYFRAADWDSKTAAGLMTATLKPKIETIIASTASNGHLRSLLVEGLEGTLLAAELADTLETIVLSPERFYREREDAAEALLPHRDRSWWQATIATLTDQGGDDAPRLAIRLIRHIDIDVSNELLVAALFADMGVTICPLPRRKGKRVHRLSRYEPLLDSLASERLIGMLDLTGDYAELLEEDDWENADQVADLMAHLIVRAIDEGVVGSDQATSVWRWLGIIKQAHHNDHDAQRTLAEQLAKHDSLRRAIQTHALVNTRHEDSLWVMAFQLHERFVGLTAHPGDIAYALNRLAEGDVNDPNLRQDWMDLVRIGRGPDGLDQNVRAAAERFRRGDKPLADYLCKLENPKKPAWQIKQERYAAKRARKRQISFEIARRRFEAVRDDLRAGELNATQPCAMAYLGQFGDLPSELSPDERLAEWIGPALRDDALIGFEAVLHRDDLPSAAEIADGFTRDKAFGYSFAIMAGLYERMRSGRNVADLSESLKQAALLLSYDDPAMNLEKEKQELCAALEAEVIPTPETRREFAQLWIEPALAAGNERIHGLYKLAHDPDWQSTGAALAAAWLSAFPNVPETVEAELVDCLTFGGELNALREVAEARASTVFRSFEHMLSWLAIDVLVRFDVVRPDITGIGADCPRFIWFLRDRLTLDRGAGSLPLTAAQAEWIITEFREPWPYATLGGSGWGDTNDYDATNFLNSLINRIANDTSIEASEAMARLVSGPNDSYANSIRHMMVEQRQKRAEESFSALTPGDLGALLSDKPPGNIEDLKAMVLEEMDVARRKLIGDDLDSVVGFWSDCGIPRDENRCRDRLAEMISPELARYDIERITEADMPQTKRADLAFARGSMQLPIEVKGQWHRDVWDAATGQLDDKYLIDWRSEQRGIYCVLWFGDMPARSNRRLKVHPDGLPAPAGAEEMRQMITARIPEARRALIDVVVFDLTTGRPRHGASRRSPGVAT